MNTDESQKINSESNNSGNSKYLESTESFDGLMITAIIYRHKIFISIVVFLATAASVVLTLMMPNEFKSEVNVVPPKKTGSMLEGALGNISSALRDFGLTQIGKQGGGGYSFVVILNSRSVADSLIKIFDLHKRYDIPKNRPSLVRDVLWNNMDVSLEKPGNFTISIWDEDPKIAAEMANKTVDIANKIAINLFRDEATVNRQYVETRLNHTDSTLEAIDESLKKFSKEKKIFSPLDQASSASEAFGELKAKKMESEILYELFKTNYGDYDIKTQFQKKLVEELTDQLEKAENVPGFVGNFSMSDAADVGIEYMRLYAEFETYTKVKAFLMPMMEQAKIDEYRSTPSLYIVDKALPADKKDRPKRSLYVLGSCVGSFIISVLLIVLINGFKSFKKKYNIFIKATG